MTLEELIGKVQRALESVNAACNAVGELGELSYPFLYKCDMAEVSINRNQYSFFNTVEIALDAIEQSKNNLESLKWGLETSTEEDWKADVLRLIEMVKESAGQEEDAKEDGDEESGLAFVVDGAKSLGEYETNEPISYRCALDTNAWLYDDTAPIDLTLSTDITDVAELFADE